MYLVLWMNGRMCFCLSFGHVDYFEGKALRNSRCSQDSGLPFSSLVKVHLLSHVQLFVTPWTVAYQAPLSMEFSRQEYWSVLSTAIPFPGDLPNQKIKPASSALQADCLPSEPPGKPKNTGVGSLSLLQGIFLTQGLNQVSCIAGRFFTNWAI